MDDAPPELSTLLLGRLCETITLIASGDLSDDDRALIPGWWLEAVRLPSRDGLERALVAWQAVLPDALPGFSRSLLEHGIGVFLGRSNSDGKPVLLYAATSPSGETFCWYGFPPARELRHPTLDLTGLPTGPRDLYTQLHDGFKLAFAFHNGFPSSTEWFAIGEDLPHERAEFADGVAAPDLAGVVPLFFDFGASAVCVELGGPTDDRGGWIISDSRVDPVDDVWAVIDRWMLSLTGS